MPAYSPIYRLECYSLLKADLHFLDFVVMRFLMKLFRTANKGIIDECRSLCNFFLPTEMTEIKSNKFCKKIGVTRACWDISISVLAKRFSFAVIVILLHTLVKTVRSYHCLFVAVSIFSFFYLSYHSWWIKMFNTLNTVWFYMRPPLV